jgi:hypothetical protein
VRKHGNMAGFTVYFHSFIEFFPLFISDWHGSSLLFSRFAVLLSNYSYKQKVSGCWENGHHMQVYEIIHYWITKGKYDNDLKIDLIIRYSFHFSMMRS